MIITLPILEGLDGTQKMSKSLNNHIGLTDSPKDIFGKTMSIPDELITRYFSLLTNTPKDTIEQMQTQMKNPRDFKIELAKTLVARLHSQDAANAAHSEFLEIFANKGVPDTIPEIKIPPSPISIVDIIAEYNILPSKKEARRMVEQGAVSIDDEKITDPTTPQHPTTGQVLKVGKRKFYQFA